MIHPRTNWKRRGVTAAVAVAAVLQFAPNAAGAVEVAGEVTDAVTDAVANHAVDGEQVRFRLRLLAHRDGRAERPTDRPSDRPTDRPTDRPADRPADRPTDRPDEDEDEREDVFPIGAIGRVHLAWTGQYVRIVEVGFEDGWKHRVVRDGRKALAIHFTNGESCGVFRAGLRPDGLHTDTSRHDCPSDKADVRTNTFAVGDIGKVSLAWTANAIRIQEVVAAEGWRHRQHQQHRGKVTVGFTNGEQCVTFTAVLTEDGLRDEVTRRDCDVADGRAARDTRPVEANATRA